MATYNGDSGNNTHTGSNFADSISGGDGNDTLAGEGGADTIRGGNDNDLIAGDSGNDRLFGDAGDDTLAGGSGNDTIDGGAGTDTATYAAAGAAVTVNLATGSATGEGNDTLSNIENVTGSAFADTIGGSAADNLLSGGAGNDSLAGGGGADTLDGGAGNDSLAGGDGADTLDGGAGNDTLAGGAGIDTADYSGSAAGVTVNLATGTATGAGTDALSGIENVAGTDHADSLTGDGTDNVLTGGTGNDTILGGDGNDQIVAGPEAPVATAALDLNWSLAGGDGADLSCGITQNTGGMNVAVSYVDDGRGTDFEVETTDTVYTAPGEAFSPTSNAKLAGTGAGNTSTTRFDFAAEPGSGWQNAVQDVAFRINDVDASLHSWQDVITVRGYDAAGNPVPVTLTAAGNDVVSVGTVTAGLSSDTSGSADGSVLVQIAGPVARVEIDYNNTWSSSQLIRVSDVRFTTLAEGDSDSVDGGAGNDTVTGGYGADHLHGGAGADSLEGGEGDDTLDGGADNDTLQGGPGDDSLAGGAGNDSLLGGDGADTLHGGDGDDVLDGGVGPDLVIGGAGRDTILGGIDDTVDGSEGETDEDVLDLRPYGKALTTIHYDPLNPENGWVEFLNPNGVVVGTMGFSNIENVVPCFTPGTLIATDRGPRAVEDLVPGDRMLTRDSGFRPIVWAGRRALGAEDLRRNPSLAPVRIARGALGDGLPLRDLVVSPQHRMLFVRARAELYFGEREVLVPAIHLVGQPGITRDVGTPVTYIHVMCARHEIVQAEGCWSESFQPGAQVLSAMDAAVRDELVTLFPELAQAGGYPAARITLRAHETRTLLAA